MNGIKSVIISLIFTSVAISICELLVPKDSKNQIRLITGTVLILSLVTPFLSGINFEDVNFDVYSKDIDVSYNTEKAIVMSIKCDIQDVLDEIGIKKGKIIVETGFDAQGSIIIEHINILLEEPDKPKTKLILDNLQQIYDFKIEIGDI